MSQSILIQNSLKFSAKIIKMTEEQNQVALYFFNIAKFKIKIIKSWQSQTNVLKY